MDGGDDYRHGNFAPVLMAAIGVTCVLLVVYITVVLLR